MPGLGAQNPVANLAQKTFGQGVADPELLPVFVWKFDETATTKNKE